MSTSFRYAILCGEKYLKKVGSSMNPGYEWSDTISEARMYESEKALDRTLLSIARSYSDGSWPVVVEVEVKIVRTINHEERFRKNRARAEKAQATWRVNQNKRQIEKDRQYVALLEDQLKRAKERTGMT